MTDRSQPDTALAQWVALSLIPHLGGRTIDRLIAHFGTLDAIYAASEDALRAVRGIGPTFAVAIQALDVPRTQAAIAVWQADGIAILLRDDATYPDALRGVDDAPPVLFVRGALAARDQRAIAIIGTRRPSAHARQHAQRLAAALAEAGWTVVSGMAAGIDAAAHAGALDAGGRTLAVLGCGVRVAYPPEHRLLAQHIAANGALLSEVHPDAAPNGPALVARNRLVSGLSRAVVVIETGATGGSLHTVRFAQAQGVPVLALDTSAPGNRQLIADGAPALPVKGTGAALLAALEGGPHA